MKLKTRYLGLDLCSPTIVSSSGLTSTLQRIKDAEAAGAGAVVLKSIFEEQILNEAALVDSYSDYPEASDYVQSYVKENSLGLYLKLIEDVKQQCGIPVIASINCRQAGDWVDYARVIETAGADALELNIFLLPTDKETSAEEIERNYLEVITRVRNAIRIPLSVKLGAGFTNPLAIVRELYYRNVQGVVLFNRFYPTDIDIERMTVRAGNIFSSRAELSNVLRWTGLVNGSLPLIDVAVSTGVHTGADAVKALLAGASAVEVASVLYERGMGAIGEMNDFIRDWMERHDFRTLEEFRGRLNAKNIRNPMLYERTQFMKYYSSHEL